MFRPDLSRELRLGKRRQKYYILQRALVRLRFLCGTAVLMTLTVLAQPIVPTLSARS